MPAAVVVRCALAALLLAPALSAETAADLAARVRAALAAGRADAEIAAEIRQARLTDRLEDPLIETLDGTGPLAAAELERQRDASALLPESPWKPPAAEPAPSADEQGKIVAAAREIALQYAAGLPNFLCTETVRRYEGKRGRDARLRDTLALDVSFNGKTDRYRLRTINGKPTTKSMYEVGGFRSEGDFGALQRLIFDPSAEALFTWSRSIRIGGRPADVVAFHIGADRSQYMLDFRAFKKNARMVAGARGEVYLDAETHKVLRLRIEAEGIPPDWPVKRALSVLDYSYAEIGGRSYLLPRVSEMRLYTKDGPYRNVIEFGNYRRFASDATISFK